MPVKYRKLGSDRPSTGVAGTLLRDDRKGGFSLKSIAVALLLIVFGAFISTTVRTGGVGWLTRVREIRDLPEILEKSRRQSSLGNISLSPAQGRGLPAVPSALAVAGPALSLPAAAPAVASPVSNATAAVRTAFTTKLEMKLQTEQQQQEWNDGEISFLTGSGSCSDVCGREGGLVCARDWFLYADRCAVAQAVFPDGRCTEVFAPYAPAFQQRTSEVLISKDSRSDPPTCDAVPPSGDTRLCPCIPKSHARTSLAKPGLVAVKDVIEKLLTEQEAHERLELSRGAKEGIEIDHNGVQMSSILIQNIKAERVSFYAGKLGESCEAVCKTEGLKCETRWFKTLNKCEVLMAAWPQSRTGAYYKQCSTMYYGHDLPALQDEMDKLLLNNDAENYPTTCGGRSDHGERLCPCAYRYPNTRATFHTVFSVESKQYFEWQSRYNVFWHKQAGQPGKITRLLSMGGAWPTNPAPHPVGDHLMNEVPTHVAPKYDQNIDQYSAYNKPLAITHWLTNTKVEEDVIIITDPDCAFIGKFDTPVEEGAPIANQGYYTFKEENSVEMQIAKHYCRGACRHFDPIAVPVVIHRKDLERLAPRWLKYTEDIRKDREGPNKWPIEWNDNRFTTNRIEWVAEMFGYVIAAAELDLRHEMADLQLVPSVHRMLTPGVPIIHFHVRMETADHKFWNKGDDRAGQIFPWPVAPGTDAVTTRMLTALHDAYTALGETDRYKQGLWASYSGEWDNPQRRRLLLAPPPAAADQSPASESSGLSEPLSESGPPSPDDSDEA